GVGFLQRLPAPELVEHLLLGLFPDGAGIEQQQVGLIRAVDDLRVMGLAQHVQHPRRIVLVHLATVGLDEDLAGTGWRIEARGGDDAAAGLLVADGHDVEWSLKMASADCSSFAAGKEPLTYPCASRR